MEPKAGTTVIGATMRFKGELRADEDFVFQGRIEGAIHHTQNLTIGTDGVVKGDVYFSVEGGNGEVGFYVVSDGTDRPYRLHLRAPCFHIVSALEQLIRGRFVADVVPTFGSMNMIGGELDR